MKPDMYSVIADAVSLMVPLWSNLQLRDGSISTCWSKHIQLNVENYALYMTTEEEKKTLPAEL